MQDSPHFDTRSSLHLNDRPLQKSMMQLSSRSPHNSPKTHINYHDFTQVPLLKKSQLVSTDNLPLESSSVSPPPNFSFSQKSYQYQPVLREHKLSQEAGTSSSALKQKYSPMVRQEAKSDSNPEQLLRFGNGPAFDKKIPNIQKEQLLKEVMGYLKEQYLPSVIKIVKKEVIEEINSLKQDLQHLKQETRNTLKRQDQSLLRLSLSHSQSSVKPKIGSLSSQLSQSQELCELQTQFFLLENKLAQIEQQNSQRFQQHQNQLQRFESKLLNSAYNQAASGPLSKSLIKSSLPPLLLEYKQLLTFKKDNKVQEQVLSEVVYFIDSQGFLLDQDSYYLLDGRGAQIKLYQQHVKLLAMQQLMFQ